jgi:replicative DNA helicase
MASLIKTNAEAERRIERMVACSLMAMEGDHLLTGLALLAEQCPPPFHDWFQQAELKALSIAWGAILEGTASPTLTAIYDLLGITPYASLADILANKKPKPSPGCEYENSALKSIGGPSRLNEVIGTETCGASFRSACVALRNIRHRAIAIETLREVAIAVAGSPINDGPSEQISCGIERMASIVTQSNDQNVGTAMAGAIASAEIIAKNREEGKERCVSWGVDALDEACPIRNGGLYILAARPGCGKTSLALQSASASAANGNRVGIVSLEMGGGQLAMILASRAMGIRREHLERKEPSITEEVWQELHALAARWQKDRNIVIMDQGNTGQQVTAETVAAWARIKCKIGGISYIIIDYCQLIGSTDQRATEYTVISKTTRTLKTLAQSLQVPILLLSQMSRDIDKGTARPPKLSDLRGSGSLEQDADAVLFLHDASEGKANPRPIHGILAKNRSGQQAEIPMGFDGRWQMFTQLETSKQHYAKQRAAKVSAPPSDDEHLFA